MCKSFVLKHIEPAVFRAIICHETTVFQNDFEGEVLHRKLRKFCFYVYGVRAIQMNFCGITRQIFNSRQISSELLLIPLS